MYSQDYWLTNKRTIWVNNFKSTTDSSYPNIEFFPISCCRWQALIWSRNFWVYKIKYYSLCTYNLKHGSHSICPVTYHSWNSLSLGILTQEVFLHYFRISTFLNLLSYTELFTLSFFLLAFNFYFILFIPVLISSLFSGNKQFLCCP